MLFMIFIAEHMSSHTSSLAFINKPIVYQEYLQYNWFYLLDGLLFYIAKQ